MPEPEQTKDSSHHSEKTETQTAVQSARPVPVVIAAVVGGLVLLLIGGAFGVAIGVNMNRNHTTRTSVATSGTIDRGMTRRPGGYMSRQYDSNSATTARGVVTSVSDTSLVVAGDGTTKTFTLNSSTVYSNSVKPAVDDTVAVRYDGSGTNLTATTVRVINAR